MFRPITSVAGRVLGPSLAMTYLSLIVLIPVVAIASQALHDGWSSFITTVTQRETVEALEAHTHQCRHRRRRKHPRRDGDRLGARPRPVQR